MKCFDLTRVLISMTHDNLELLRTKLNEDILNLNKTIKKLECIDGMRQAVLIKRTELEELITDYQLISRYIQDMSLCEVAYTEEEDGSDHDFYDPSDDDEDLSDLDEEI